MQIHSYKTQLVNPGDNLFAVLKDALPKTALKEDSILTIASKIPATCENRFVKKQTGSSEEKHNLVMQEADWFLPASESKYDLMLTIKGNWMFANAGIDESNAHDMYVLWPKDPQQTAEQIWQWLKETYGLKNVGVIITDSRSMPLSWGVVGHGIAYCGFEPLRSYVDKPDLFGRLMKMEQLNIVQCLAGVAALVMGEGAEQTPLATITDLEGSVVFLDRPPSSEELASLEIEMAEDMYAPLLMHSKWQKGGSGQ